MAKKRSKGVYMISSVSEQYGIHPQTLRLYEREGLLTPSRSDGNTRLYTDEDLERLEVILQLTREHRTRHSHLQNTAWVDSKIPTRGLAANLPISALFVLNVVFSVVTGPDRVRLQGALEILRDAAFHDYVDGETVAGLRSLFRVALNGWEQPV
ncbi:MAG: MerR family transcriptional regulator [Bryobacteraceae bacterium]